MNKQKKESKERLEAKRKAIMFVSEKAKNLPKEMPYISQMTDSEYHAFVYGMQITGVFPEFAIEVVIDKVKNELLRKKES